MINDNFNKYIEINIDKLVKANWNYKEDDEVKRTQLTENIKRNGQVENILIRELESGFYEVLNGNHRLDVFIDLNYDKVICYNFGKISLAQAQRIAIETNETKFPSNPEKLAKLIEEIMSEFDFEDLKTTLPFTDDEFRDMEALANGLADGIPDDINDIHDDNSNIPLPDEPETILGDLYEFESETVKHRLLCGDSTSTEDLDRLMNGDLAHMIHTDPPYNVKYAEFNKSRGNGKDWTDSYCSAWDDDMSDDDYKTFLYNFISNGKRHLIEYGHLYIWHSTTYYCELLEALRKAQIPYDKVPLIWVKQVAPLSWARYGRKHEPCVFAGKGATTTAGDGARWFGPNNEVTIWEIDRDHNGDYIHPTQKPLAIPSRAIRNSSRPGENVLDLFMGSGSTFIASDILHRNSFGMELEPKFCDVIVMRYAKHKTKQNQSFKIFKNGQDITNHIINKISE